MEPLSNSPSPPAPDSGSRPDLEKVRQDQLDLREKLLSLRENDLFSLRNQVSSLASTFKIALLVGGLIVTGLGWLGLKQFSDLNQLINKSMQGKIDASLGYYDQVSKAIVTYNNRGCSAALPALKELAEKRPEDEVVFGYLSNCFIDQEEYDQGFRYLADLKGKGIFPRKFQDVISYNNAGYLLFVKSLSDPAAEREARELLRKAEQIGIASDSRDLYLPLANLALLNLSVGRMDEAASYAKRRLELPAAAKVDLSGDLDKEWFKLLEKKRPSARKDLEAMFPGSLTKQPQAR